jgi:hypothetical protein
MEQLNDDVFTNMIHVFKHFRKAAICRKKTEAFVCFGKER